MKKLARSLVLLCFLAGGFLLLSGCGGNHAAYQTSGTTLGQELQDLQTSYEKGIINNKEYEDARKRLMKKHTRY